ncbi:MAG: hypothetical protein M5U26_15385 [Planctomycetota bacterium]|nr:hypothetical protein [Planctomycetota bacterium]
MAQDQPERKPGKSKAARAGAPPSKAAAQQPKPKASGSGKPASPGSKTSKPPAIKQAAPKPAAGRAGSEAPGEAAPDKRAPKPAPPPDPPAPAEPEAPAGENEGPDSEKLAAAKRFAEEKLRREAEARRPFLSRTWRVRILWVFVIVFGMGVYKGVSLLVGRAPPREREKTEQTALNKLAKRPLDSLLPLAKPLLEAEPLPYPAATQALPEPRVAVKRVAILTPLPAAAQEDAPADARALALGFSELLRRDLLLVDTLSVFDGRATDRAFGTFKDQVAALGPVLKGLETVVQVAVEKKEEHFVVRAAVGPPADIVPVQVPELKAKPGETAQAARALLLAVCRELGVTVGAEARKRIDAYVPREDTLVQTGQQMLAAPDGRITGNYAANPLMTGAQLRRTEDRGKGPYLKAILALDSNHVEARLMSEEVLPPNEAQAAAMQHLKEALDRSPHFGPAHLQKSRRLLAAGQADGALEEAALAAALMPGHPLARVNLAETYLACHAPLPARKHADLAFEAAPNLPQTHALRIRIAEVSGEPERAVELARAFVERLPDSGEARASLVRALRLAGKPDEAGAELKAIPEAALEPAVRARLAAELAWWQGRPDAALEALQAAGDAPEAKALREEIEAFRELPGAAHKVLESARVSEFMFAAANAQILERLALKDKLEEAVARMEALAPGDPRALRWRIRVLAHQGKRFESLEFVERLNAALKPEGAAEAPPPPRDLQDAAHEVEALLAHARFDHARKVLDALGMPAGAPFYRRLKARIELVEGLFYATQLNDFDYAKARFLNSLQLERKNADAQKAILGQMENFLRLLVQSGKEDEAALIPQTFNSMLDDPLVERLRQALAEALTVQKKNKKH